MIKTGIENIRCFAIAAGVGADGSAVNEALSCVVNFKSEHDKFHQVYVNGSLAGVTVNAKQRKMIVPLSLLRKRTNVVEVAAVDAVEKQTDFTKQLAVVSMGRLKVSIPGLISLPYDGFAEVYSNGGEGQINFAEPVSNQPIKFFSSKDDENGFGLNKFGVGDFGFDLSGCVGFGVGDFGVGEHGFDCNSIKWESPELDSGKYKVGVKVTDGRGNSVTVSNETEVAVIAGAVPAEALTAESYDKTQNELILNVS